MSVIHIIVEICLCAEYSAPLQEPGPIRSSSICPGCHICLAAWANKNNGLYRIYYCQVERYYFFRRDDSVAACRSHGSIYMHLLRAHGFIIISSVPDLYSLHRPNECTLAAVCGPTPRLTPVRGRGDGRPTAVL